jgi:hypothetical protein
MRLPAARTACAAGGGVCRVPALYRLPLPRWLRVRRAADLNDADTPGV